MQQQFRIGDSPIFETEGNKEESHTNIGEHAVKLHTCGNPSSGSNLVLRFITVPAATHVQMVFVCDCVFCSAIINCYKKIHLTLSLESFLFEFNYLLIIFLFYIIIYYLLFNYSIICIQLIHLNFFIKTHFI